MEEELVELTDEELARFYGAEPEQSPTLLDASPTGSSDCTTENREGSTLQRSNSVLEIMEDKAISVASVSSLLIGPLAETLVVASSTLSPLSVACGVVSAGAGGLMVAKGVTTASGHVDKHLVVGGSCTAALGAASATLSVASCIVASPLPFMIGSVVIAGVDLTCSAVLDASMDGLCQRCRAGSYDSDTETARVSLTVIQARTCPETRH